MDEERSNNKPTDYIGLIKEQLTEWVKFNQDSDFSVSGRYDKAIALLDRIQNRFPDIVEAAARETDLMGNTIAQQAKKAAEQKKAKQQTINPQDAAIFNRFISGVTKEYQQLRLLRTATMHTFHHLSPLDRAAVGRVLKSKGAVDEATLSSVVKKAVETRKEKQKALKRNIPDPERSR